MRIIKLEVENFKRITALEILPTGELVVIAGKNGAGKSSVLDAIWAALGGADAVPPQPIRQGANKAFVRLTLSDGLVVERRFTENGTSLFVTDEEGTVERRKPQELLNALTGKLAFDPLAFMRMKAREQKEELQRIVPLGMDLAEHDRQRQELYDRRTDANKEVKRLEGALEKLPRHDDAPAEPESVGDLTARLTEARRRADRMESLATQIAQLESALEKARIEQAQLRLEKGESAEELEARLAAIEDNNRKARDNELYNRTLGELSQARIAADELDASLKNLDEKKAEALRKAAFPVPGLSFSEDGVLYKGLPLEQCSTSEQITISTKIAMQANPDLRVILTKEGSLLDEENLRALAEMAKGGDYQLWVEVVADLTQTGVLIEDGHVADN